MLSKKELPNLRRALPFKINPSLWLVYFLFPQMPKIILLTLLNVRKTKTSLLHRGGITPVIHRVGTVGIRLMRSMETHSPLKAQRMIHMLWTTTVQ